MCGKPVYLLEFHNEITLSADHAGFLGKVLGEAFHDEAPGWREEAAGMTGNSKEVVFSLAMSYCAEGKKKKQNLREGI